MAPDPSTDSFLLIWATIGLPALSVLALAVFGLLLSSYVKIVTVLGILRAGLGVTSVPSAFITSGLALMLSILVMGPTMDQATNAMDEEHKRLGGLSSDVQKVKVVEAGAQEWKKFLNANVDEVELAYFTRAAYGVGLDGLTDEHRDSWRVLAPAFFVSELKEAFTTGLSIFLPFLVIDLLVAVLLTTAGLVQLNPVLIGLPFKLLLFVLVDGWSLITSQLVAAYAAGGG